MSAWRGTTELRAWSAMTSERCSMPTRGDEDFWDTAAFSRSRRTQTENLMTYALGRRVDHADMPTIRGIIRQAEGVDYRLSAFVVGIVKSPAFRMKAADRSTFTADARR